MLFTSLVAAVNHDVLRLQIALWEVDPELRSSALADVHQGIKNENIENDGAGGVCGGITPCNGCGYV